MPRFDFQFDKISFWAGFLAASLFWWVVRLIRPFIPLWRAQLVKTVLAMRQRNLQGVENSLRAQTIRYAQKQHLASSLFALDEILIPPYLLVPPGEHDPETAPGNPSIASRVIPYVPEWPELVASLGVQTMGLAQAVQAGRHLVILGQPGSGKTVALAHLAIQLAHQEPALGKPAFPIYLHALDIDLPLQEGESPLQKLITPLSGRVSRVLQPQVSRLIHTYLRDEQRITLLLLDGLEELPPARFSDTVAYLKMLIKQFPRLQIVTTATSEYLDGLTNAGFLPLSLAAWNAKQREQLMEKWGRLWTDHIQPGSQKETDIQTIDPLLLFHWLRDETPAYRTPLEWTLRVWSAYAGDTSGNNTVNILSAHLSRFLPGPDLTPALGELANRMVQDQRVSLTYNEMESILSKVKLSLPSTLEIVDEKPDAGAPAEPIGDSTGPAGQPTPPPNKARPVKDQRRKTRRDRLMSQGEAILSALLEAGILLEHPNQQIRFCNPVFLGLLSGTQVSSDETGSIAQAAIPRDSWAVLPQVLRFASACHEHTDWIDIFIQDPNAPLFHNILMAARWLQDAPPNANWRPAMMRTLVSALQDETLPLGARARLVAAFSLSRDPAIHKLYKQLLVSKSPLIRRATLLACGASGHPQYIQDILPLLADPLPEVRLTACLALAAIPAEPAFNAVVEILLSGDEDLRQAAAEALAKQPGEGQEILKEAAGIDDLVTRRAAVFGLLQVPDEWARKTLERMAVEDGQWVVRNAAAQALETHQQPDQIIPKPLPAPSDSPWMITFASKLGMGILPGQPATEVIQMILKSGTIEEQIAALPYLRETTDKEMVQVLQDFISSGAEEIREPALYTLWWMAVSGKEQPA